MARLYRSRRPFNIVAPFLGGKFSMAKADLASSNDILFISYPHQSATENKE